MRIGIARLLIPVLVCLPLMFLVKIAVAIHQRVQQAIVDARNASYQEISGQLMLRRDLGDALVCAGSSLYWNSLTQYPSGEGPNERPARTAKNGENLLVTVVGAFEQVGSLGKEARVEPTRGTNVPQQPYFVQTQALRTACPDGQPLTVPGVDKANKLWSDVVREAGGLDATAKKRRIEFEQQMAKLAEDSRKYERTLLAELLNSRDRERVPRPSFSCTSAGLTSLERFICSDADIAEQERAMVDSYNAVRLNIRPERRNVFEAEHFRAFSVFRQACNLPMTNESRRSCVGRYLTERLMVMSNALDALCRGGAGSEAGAIRACEVRDVPNRQLVQLGWCSGKSSQDDRVAWHRCDTGSVKAK